jgi:hypothetical protein
MLMRLLPPLLWFVALAAVAPPVAADTTRLDSASSDGVLMIQAAPGVLHFHPDPEHTDYSWLVGAEWLYSSRWLAGFSYFNNSFGQKSQYYYGGRWWRISESDPNWYFKLTAGVIAGYKQPYEDKIPYNHNGIAPGIIPAIGYQVNRFNIQLNFLGTSALMVTVGYDLIR